MGLCKAKCDVTSGTVMDGYNVQCFILVALHGLPSQAVVNTSKCIPFC